MQTRVIVNGSQGKMGQIACKAIIDHPEFQLVAELGRGDNIQRTVAETQAQIVIDLTRADCAFSNAMDIIESGAHPIIGTSGLVEEEIATLRQRCDAAKLGGIIAPNFSIGAMLMMRIAAFVAAHLPEVEIIEAHHQQKFDCPSSTAIKTAETILSARHTPKKELMLKETIPHARGATLEDINIHSIRLPGIIAQQQVLFGQTGETLSITHQTLDRTSFMPGLIMACQRVIHLDTLYYGLEQFIFQERL